MSVHEVMNRIYRRADREEEDLNGFYGDMETPVVVDWINYTYIVQHRIMHAHDLEGNCVKNRFGPLCGNES